MRDLRFSGRFYFRLNYSGIYLSFRGAGCLRLYLYKKKTWIPGTLNVEAGKLPRESGIIAS
jgi:hypothetical protein